MPGFLTDHISNRILDCLFGGEELPAPCFLFVGLSLARANKGGKVVEPDSPSYRRVLVMNDLDQFTKADGGCKFNGRPIEFPSPAEDWGSVVSVFIADEGKGGNVLAMADLPSPSSIIVGRTAPTIVANGLFLGLS